MDTFETQLASDMSSGLPRAQRIRDDEWEVWRDTLTRLYIEDDMSRKDLINTMAKEHQFIIK